MSPEIFLEDYFSIVLFLLIALILSCGFIFLNFMLSPSKPDPEKLISLMSVVLNHLMIQEWNLMLDFI